MVRRGGRDRLRVLFRIGRGDLFAADSTESDRVDRDRDGYDGDGGGAGSAHKSVLNDRISCVRGCLGSITTSHWETCSYVSSYTCMLICEHHIRTK